LGGKSGKVFEEGDLIVEVPFINLNIQNRDIKREIFQLWEEIFDSAGFVGGEHVEKFEEEFARACGVQYCVSLNSGTDALRFILLAQGLRPGDEVITVPNTFIGTAEAISQAGGKIVFVDVDPVTYTMNPEKLESAITSRTRGIVPVHIFGHTADMDPIIAVSEKYGLWIVEDACQAHLAEYKGRKAGSIGKAGAFSFYPAKNMGACGEAGAVTTDDAKLADKLRMLRDHGQKIKYRHQIEGYNGRCDALQAAVLRVKLKYVDSWNDSRRENAAHYIKFLNGAGEVILPRAAEEDRHVYHLFVVQVSERDEVAEALLRVGIGTAIHYPTPLHLQKAYAHMAIPPGSFPVTESCAERFLSLPMFPELTEEQIAYVCRELIAAVKNLSK
jgi:dTDP-4-amino-4,6-dideoxygalactose transaminase